MFVRTSVYFLLLGSHQQKVHVVAGYHCRVQNCGRRQFLGRKNDVIFDPMSIIFDENTICSVIFFWSSVHSKTNIKTASDMIISAAAKLRNIL